MHEECVLVSRAACESGENRGAPRDGEDPFPFGRENLNSLNPNTTKP